MLDKWLNEDINNLFQKGSTIVLVDESCDIENILDKLKFDCKIYKANSLIEELEARYNIEKTFGENSIIYTNSKYEQLKFILEYASVNGCVKMYSLADYVKNKLYKNYNIVLNNLSPSEYKSAAIYSIGKDISYWHTIQTKGADGILDIKSSSLEFLNNPTKYINSLDKTSQDAFYHKVFELLNTQYIEKPATTLAKELSIAIFDNLLYAKEDKQLKEIYNAWIDSKEYNKSFNTYLKDYKINNDINIWKCDCSHPFESIDKQVIKEFASNINNREFKANHSVYLTKRLNMQNKLPFNVSYFNALKTIINFDADSIAQISNHKKAVEFYKNNISQLDDAVRKMFVYTSDDKQIMENIEEFYKEQITIFLDKWFTYFDEYNQNQTGILQNIIDENSSKKIAVIVGDGISYSIAKNIANKLKDASYNFKENHINSDYPSETENNMSQIYCDDGHVEKIQQNRRTYLVNKNDLNIEFVDIEKLTNESGQLANVLICTAKDIDELGEKLQAQALEYFDKAEDSIVNAISLLLSNGFKKVYLISDHGFVLSKILTDADKVEVSFSGKYTTNERYIVSEEKQNASKLIEINKNDKYLYFSKNINPFKTAGKYGYSHGGLTPQELITPFFSWEKQDDLNDLEIKITNKSALKDNMGELFTIKLSAKSDKTSLFNNSRKIFIKFFVDGNCVNTTEVYEITANEEFKKEYTLNGSNEMQIQILDANSKELLDSAKIIKNQGRDLGGLL